MSIGQYLKETQAEMRHVAWPTRTQTIVYTILVAALSVVISLYLGLFDYLFTSTLARVVESLPARGPSTPPGLIISTSTPSTDSTNSPQTSSGQAPTLPTSTTTNPQ